MEKNRDHPKTYTQKIKEAEAKNPEYYDKKDNKIRHKEHPQ